MSFVLDNSWRLDSLPIATQDRALADAARVAGGGLVPA